MQAMRCGKLFFSDVAHKSSPVTLCVEEFRPRPASYLPDHTQEHRYATSNDDSTEKERALFSKRII